MKNKFGRIPDDFVKEVESLVAIEDVVAAAVELKQQGANLFGCCPFHKEKSASFSVSPSKGFYHCFGCGANGGAISFRMNFYGEEFPEAVESLATMLGKEVPREGEPRELTEAELKEIAKQKKIKEAHLAKVEALKKTKKESLFFEKELLISQDVGYTETGIKYASKDGPKLTSPGLVFPIKKRQNAVCGFQIWNPNSGSDAVENVLFEKDGAGVYGMSQNAVSIATRACTIFVVNSPVTATRLKGMGLQNTISTVNGVLNESDLKIIYKNKSSNMDVVMMIPQEKPTPGILGNLISQAASLLSGKNRIRFLCLNGKKPEDAVKESIDSGADGADEISKDLKSETVSFTTELINHLISLVKEDEKDSPERAQFLFGEFKDKLPPSGYKASLEKSFNEKFETRVIEVMKTLKAPKEGMIGVEGERSCIPEEKIEQLIGYMTSSDENEAREIAFPLEVAMSAKKMKTKHEETLLYAAMLTMERDYIEISPELNTMLDEIIDKTSSAETISTSLAKGYAVKWAQIPISERMEEIASIPERTEKESKEFADCLRAIRDLKSFVSVSDFGFDSTSSLFKNNEGPSSKSRHP